MPIGIAIPSCNGCDNHAVALDLRNLYLYSGEYVLAVGDRVEQVISEPYQPHGPTCGLDHPDRSDAGFADRGVQAGGIRLSKKELKSIKFLIQNNENIPDQT